MLNIEICVAQEDNSMYVSLRLKQTKGPLLRQRLSPMMPHLLPPQTDESHPDCKTAIE